MNGSGSPVKGTGFVPDGGWASKLTWASKSPWNVQPTCGSLLGRSSNATPSILMVPLSPGAALTGPAMANDTASAAIVRLAPRRSLMDMDGALLSPTGVLRYTGRDPSGLP